jgi:hypothetical protein
MSATLTTDLPPEDHVEAFINGLLVSIMDELMKIDGRPSITLRRRPKARECIINSENGALEAPTGQDALITYSWPGKSVYEAWRFGKWPGEKEKNSRFLESVHDCIDRYIHAYTAILIRVLSLIYEAVHDNSVVSKRLVSSEWLISLDGCSFP